MIIIKDNALSLESRNHSVYTVENSDSNYHWVDSESLPTFLHPLVIEASRYFNLANIAGFEWWVRGAGVSNTISWHIDKDEGLSNDEDRLSLPECSIIYYPLISNIKEGYFKTEDIIITPKSNRLIIMDSSMMHTFDSYTGTRYSLMLNPWTYKPKYLNEGIV